MKFWCFLILFVHNQSFPQFGNADPDEYALVLRPHENELEFAWPAITNTGEFHQYYVWNNDILYLCPTEPKPALKIVEKFNDYQNYAPAKKLCDEPVQPTIFQVQKELQNNMHLYQIGFLVNDEQLRNLEKFIEYVTMNKEYYFEPMISFYRDTELQHTIVAYYHTIEVDIHKQLQDDALKYQHSDLFIDKMEKLYHNQESILKETLGDKFVANKHTLVLDSLVNENDFIVDTWKKTARFKVLQIPIWKENHKIWKHIREYIRHIFKFSVSTQITTAGVGKALTIRDNANHEYKMEWGTKEEKIFIPELYWVAIEYRFTENYERTGMFVIMHNLPGAGEQNIEKICETNVCIRNQLWTPSDQYEPWKQRVYCCPMDNETITKLGMKFLLRERNLFEEKKRIVFPPAEL